MSGSSQTIPPSLIIAPAPSPPSSAGWNTIATRPLNDAFCPARIFAMTSATAVWPSCPQACISPFVCEA